MRMSFDATSRKKSATNRHHSDRSLSSSTLEQTSVFFFQAFLVMSRNRTCRFFWLGQELPPQKNKQKKKKTILLAFLVKLRKTCPIICAWMHAMQMIHLLPTTSWKLRSILPSTYRHCCPTWQPQRMAVLQDAFVRNAPFQPVSNFSGGAVSFFSVRKATRVQFSKLISCSFQN